ncbi:uncharacterized protein G2W53_040200 [Senna tora]|uniref:Uncharacterized protein n=1 Tax=Senna tora TaxID=362788 RepID=A0A834W8N2_9FABA|nr:uncharacterized protein G2W53_040200 [Senna tora]
MGGFWSKVREGSREKNTTEHKRKWQGKLQRGAELKGESNLSKYRSAGPLWAQGHRPKKKQGKANLQDQI